MSEYLNQLNDSQREAVTTLEGPVMVIAGPGSGKTRVLTYRIAHLLNSGVAPWNVLALTFTNKAAREMKERIVDIAGSRSNSLWMGTFHSVFARILRRESDKIGYPSDFTIYDTEDSKSVLNEIIKEMKLDKNTYNVNGVRARISAAKTQLISPEQYAKDERIRSRDQMSRRPYIHVIYERYVKRCERAGAMDFDDLLYKFYYLLRDNPEGVKEKYQAQFQYILVDEFQDTNFLQYAILKMLSRYPESKQNVCIVGDDAQSIYAFRGADISNILDFQSEYQDVKVIKLEQNYRSTIHIVNSANHLISYNKKQIKKKIWTDKTEGPKVKILRALTDTEEAKRVAGLIQEYRNRHYIEYKEMAILYRTNAQSRAFEEYLRKANIPYKIFGGLSFFQRKEVKDLLAYLRLVVNENDSEALKRSINYPRRGIGKTSLDKMLDYANKNEISTWRALTELQLPPRTTSSIKEFVQIIRHLQGMAKESNAYQVALEASKLSGMEKLLKQDTSIEGVNRLQNMYALLDGIKEFVEADEIGEGGEVANKSLSSYLQNVALMTDLDQANNEDDYVTLMTIHSAKGLEFEAIFVVGMEENIFPSFMTLNDPSQIDEERRLFYVAVTRSKRLLTLSHAKSRYQYGQIRYNDPSRFLEELPEEHIDAPTPKVKVIGEAPGKGYNTYDASPKGRVSGHFNRSPRSSSRPSPKIDTSNFRPSPSDKIAKGQQVLHLKFGKGKVLSVDGSRDKRVATIRFEDVGGEPKRLMLKFAKLQIV